MIGCKAQANKMCLRDPPHLFFLGSARRQHGPRLQQLLKEGGNSCALAGLPLLQPCVWPVLANLEGPSS